MAYTTINKSADYFNTVTYSGDGSSSRSITGVGFQPDWLWVKERSSTSSHQVADAVRGAYSRLQTDNTNAESVDSSPYNDFKSFDSDGWSMGSGGAINENSQTYVAWNWKANGAGSSNTDGTITSTVSANQTAGFSIVKWTGDSSASATVGHGLGATPQVIITKEMNGTDYWHMYHHNLSTNHNLFLNVTNAQSNPSDGTLANVGSSTFGFQGSTNVVAVNESGIDNIGYCFAEKTGYSKFGSYAGNNNADGTFVYTGFKPAFLIVKRYGGGTQDWMIYDNKRLGYNGGSRILPANTNASEGTSNAVDLLSNGFKFRTSDGNSNGYSDGYIYMAFGQSLVGSNNVPCTAR